MGTSFLFMTMMVITVPITLCIGFEQRNTGHTIFITPSSRVKCPAKPCLSLSQLAANMCWLKSNTTLSFLQGNHTLEKVMSLSSMCNLTLLSNSTLEDKVSIICHQHAGFTFSNSGSIFIKRLKLIGCSNKALSLKLLTVENTVFHGQRHNGNSSALEINGTHTAIINSSFISNTIGHCLNIFF